MGTYAFVQPVISRVTGNLEFLYLQNQVGEFLSQNCGAADYPPGHQNFTVGLHNSLLSGISSPSYWVSQCLTLVLLEV